MQVPENINIEYPERYALVIRITPEEFVFCIYKQDTRDISYYRQIPLSPEADRLDCIQQFIFDSEFLTLSYGKTSVIYISKNYDLAPQYLIQKDKKEALYNFTHFTPARQILYSPIVIQQIVTVFDVDQEIYKFLSRNLYNPEFYHHSNVIMSYLEQRNKGMDKSDRMYINFHDDFVDVFCYNQFSQILHALTFHNENERTMAYHILNLWDKCGFDQNNTPLCILDGYTTPDMYVASKLREYIKRVEFVPVANELEEIRHNELEMSLPLDMLILSAK